MKYLLIFLLLSLISCSKNKVNTDNKDAYINYELIKLLPNGGNKISAQILIRKTIDLRTRIANSNDKSKISDDLMTLVKVRMCLLNLYLASKENGGSGNQQKFFTSEMPASNFLKLDNGMFFPNEKDAKMKFEMHVLKNYPEYSELNNVVILQSSISDDKCASLVLE